MEFLTCVLSAEEDEYPAIAYSNMPLNEWSGVEFPGFDTSKLATLHSLLTGDSLQAALELYEPLCVVEGASETLVLRIEAELLAALVNLDEESIENVTTELAATEIFEREGVASEDLQNYLIALVDLAQLAESQAQALFVWIRLLQN